MGACSTSLKRLLQIGAKFSKFSQCISERNVITRQIQQRGLENEVSTEIQLVVNVFLAKRAMFWCRFFAYLGDKYYPGAAVCHNPSGDVVQHNLNAASAPRVPGSHPQSPEPSRMSHQSHWHELLILQPKQTPSLPL